MVEKATDLNETEWDDYVKRHPLGTFCHLFGWRTINQKYIKHRTHYLLSRNKAKKINGVMPLVELKSALFGHTLMSTPFCMYGGAIADDLSVQEQLESEAKNIATELCVDYLELRHQTRQHHLLNSDFSEVSAHSYFEKDLADNRDDILTAIKKKQRAVVRHSLKNELTYRIDQDIETLYRLYSISVRNLGTPVFSKKLFQGLVDVFSDSLDVLTVSKGEQAQASVLSFYFKDSVMPYYGGGIAQARSTKANDNMYYQLMCHAASNGKHTFDFGRSKNDSGAYKYKSTWGIEPKPLYHYYYLVKANELPNLSPNNPKYQTMINLWKRLPLWVSQLVGPFLSKYLG